MNFVIFPRLLAFGLTLGALPAAADPYRLVQGDRVEVMHSGLGTPKVVEVDADGDLRLTDLGGVAVAGMTLDEAQATLAERMKSLQLYVDPRVSLAMAQYAPVIVSGDVQQPGQVVFVPGMTAAAVMAMAGGTQLSGLTRSEIARARTEAEAGMRTANLDLAWASVRLARFRATLDGSALELSPAARATIPNPDAADVDTLLASEQAILKTLRDRDTEMEAFWSREIETITAQLELFDGRIAVQQGIVASAAEALESARQLTERGLQTNARFQIAEQRDADARSKVLELESAKIAAARAIADAERGRAAYRAQTAQDAQAGENEMLVALENARVRHAKFAAQAAVLGGDTLGTEAAVVRYSLISQRAGRGASDIAETTPILPGDVVTVDVSVDLPGDG